MSGSGLSALWRHEHEAARMRAQISELRAEADEAVEQGEWSWYEALLGSVWALEWRLRHPESWDLPACSEALL